MIPGRMETAARAPSLAGQIRPDKPWLNGLPRLIFISDMSDALSEDVTFEYLETEVIDAVAGDRGSEHNWLWLTKRPGAWQSSPGGSATKA